MKTNRIEKDEYNNQEVFVLWPKGKSLFRLLCMNIFHIAIYRSSNKCLLNRIFKAKTKVASILKKSIKPFEDSFLFYFSFINQFRR